MTSSAQLRDILGITGSPESSSSIIIRQGLPIESFQRVATYYQLSDAQMSKVVGTSVRSIDRLRKEQKPLSSMWSDRLYRLARIAAYAQNVFESATAATSWLKKPNRALDGCAPIDLLDTDAGTEQVAELLDRIEYGVYS